MDAVGFLHISAVLLTAAGFFGWLNVRVLKLPHTIALVLLALATAAAPWCIAPVLSQRPGLF